MVVMMMMVMMVTAAGFGRRFLVPERPYLPAPPAQPSRRRRRPVRVGGRPPAARLVIGRRRRVGRITIAVRATVAGATATATRPEARFHHDNSVAYFSCAHVSLIKKGRRSHRYTNIDMEKKNAQKFESTR